MPAKLERCVEKVMAKGHSKSSAHAICTAAQAAKEAIDLTFKHPGHANQKVHSPKGGRGVGKQPSKDKAGKGQAPKITPKQRTFLSRASRNVGRLIRSKSFRRAVSVGLKALFTAGIAIGAIRFALGKSGVEQSIINRLVNLWDSFDAVTTKEETEEGDEILAKTVLGLLMELSKAPSMMVVKEAGADVRWIALASGSFGPDRDGHWVTEKALKEWVADFNERGQMRVNGEQVVSRWRHMGLPDMETASRGRGIDLGTCDYAAYEGHTLILSGTFSDPEVGRAWASHKERDAISIGFFHPVNEPQDGLYHTIDVFEVSFTTDDRAAYPLTALSVIEGV